MEYQNFLDNQAKNFSDKRMVGGEENGEDIVTIIYHTLFKHTKQSAKIYWRNLEIPWLKINPFFSTLIEFIHREGIELDILLMERPEDDNELLRIFYTVNSLSIIPDKIKVREITEEGKNLIISGSLMDKDTDTFAVFDKEKVKVEIPGSPLLSFVCFNDPIVNSTLTSRFDKAFELANPIL